MDWNTSMVRIRGTAHGKIILVSFYISSISLLSAVFFSAGDSNCKICKMLVGFVFCLFVCLVLLRFKLVLFLSLAKFLYYPLIDSLIHSFHTVEST